MWGMQRPIKEAVHTIRSWAPASWRLCDLCDGQPAQQPAILIGSALSQGCLPAWCDVAAITPGQDTLLWKPGMSMDTHTWA